MQLSNFGRLFYQIHDATFLTQCSPINPFEIELYEETKRHFRQKLQFQPDSHALKSLRSRS